MPRSIEQKRIHYVRAAYSEGAKRPRSFQAAVEAALKKLPKQKDTNVSLPSSELLSVRHRHVARAEALKLAIGLGVPNEAMGTLGVAQDAVSDTERPSRPPSGRAFKLADAFCLIDEDELLVCTDGAIRMNKVEAYLRGLLELADAPPEARAFELVTRMNHDKAATIAEEGIKAFEIKSTAYAASTALDAVPPRGFAKAWVGLTRAIRSAFESEAESAREREVLASHWGDVNVTATFSVNGGMRGEPVVLKSLEGAAKEIQEQSPPEAVVTLVTGKGNRIGLDALTLKTTKGIRRISGQNGLDFTDVWRALGEYREELAESGRWKR